MAKKEVIKKVKDYVNLLKANNIAIEKAYLFGSQAFEEANEDSDIDVAIISQNNKKSYLQETLKLLKLARKVDFAISPQPYSLEDYKNAKEGNFLYQEIINRGILLEG